MKALLIAVCFIGCGGSFQVDDPTCLPTIAHDGMTRCLPIEGVALVDGDPWPAINGISARFYSDAECSVMLAYAPFPQARYTSAIWGNVEPQQTEIMTVLDSYTGPVYSYTQGQPCDLVTTSLYLYDLGVEIPANTFPLEKP